MKFAFIIMNNFNSKEDRASIHGGAAQIIGVKAIEDAIAVAKELQADGISCIELCGAFGAEGAKRVIDATDNKIAIGYTTHLPEQDHIFNALFGK